jgi:hypothetical protein
MAGSPPVTRTTTRRALLAWGALAAQALFVAGWLLLGVVEGHGYSAGRDDVSDLGAIGAHVAPVWLIIVGIAGALTIAFALGALRPALAGPGLPPAKSAWLVALSLPGLDNLADSFFRLDCRAADAGCTMASATASWHGKAHVITFTIAAIATVAAPFALASRMARIPDWSMLARPARAFGGGFVLGLIVTMACSGTGLQGWSQRALILYVCGGVATLAVSVLRRC